MSMPPDNEDPVTRDEMFLEAALQSHAEPVKTSLGPVHATEPPDAMAIRHMHTHSDKDANKLALHHTLGPRRTQASPGDHNHNGVECHTIGQGMGITITGAKGGNAALTSLIAALKKVMDLTDNTT
jgi:hypothetical protein